MRLLPSRSDFNIGSYLGVPLILGDGELYGSVCVLDPLPHRFTAEDLDLIVILSGWLKLYLERDRMAEGSHLS